MSLVQAALTALQRGSAGEAERLLRDAARIASGRELGLASAYLARLYVQQGRLAEAEAAFDLAIEAEPDSADLQCERGNLCQARGRLLDAVEAFARAARLRPDYAEAIYNMGNALRDLGRPDEAAAAFTRAAALRPTLAEAHNNLGNLRFLASDFAASLPHYRKALEIRPGLVDARFNLGNALKKLERYDEALATYREVGRLVPNHAPAYNNAGDIFEKLGRLPEALQCFTQAVAIDPRLYQAKRNLGTLLMQQGRVAEALACFRNVVELKPEWADGLASLVHSQLHACDWAGLDDLIARLRGAMDAGGLVPPFITATLPIPSHEQTAAAVRWAASLDVAPATRFPPRVHIRGAKIRIGYLSGDFHAHATAFLIAELIELHDRSAFDIVGYSFGPDDGSPMRARLAAAFDSFVDLRGLDDRLAAELIREDEIDILVDLKGYTQGARTRILAYRPAPVQVNWLGFPGSMGAAFIDYVIADRIVAPDRFQADCVERIVALPDCFQPNDTKRPRPVAADRAALGLPATGFVFCSFNNSYKILPAVFEVWMRLLRRVPGSVLWLLDANDLVRANLRREAAARDIAPERLVFAPRVPLPEHMNRHAAADLFLDTVPVNALTTASDALWAGLPVLTMMGDTVAGRGCASLLHAVGLPDLVAEGPDQYEALAFELATAPAALAAIRDRLRSNRDSAALFDTPRFARNLEAAFATMIDLSARGEPPQAFDVAGPASGPDLHSS